MSRIFVTLSWPGSAVATLEAAGHTVEVWPEFTAPPPEVLRHKAQGADALITSVGDRVDVDLLDTAGPQLKIVAQAGVGYDNINVEAAQKRGVWVSNAPGVLDEATADMAFALLMATARRVVEAADYVKNGHWITWHPELLLGPELYQATMGIVGLGRIGHAFARRCTGFDMRLLYTARAPKPEAEALGATFCDLDTLLAESDFVSLHVPLTPGTRHLINRERLRLMKPDAILINTARGPVIDTEALIEALEAGRIGGAGLDVTDPEPLPVDHRLLAFPNVIVTPHIASAGRQTRADMAMMAVRNILAAFEGKTPPSALFLLE